MATRGFLAIRGTIPRWAVVVLGAVPILLLGMLWGWLTHGPVEERFIAPSILPSPLEVAKQIGPLVSKTIDDQPFWRHIWISLRRVGLAYLLAVGVGLPLGVFMGAFTSLRALFSPLVTASGYIPIATLVPLTMSWFGIEETQKVVFLAMAFGIYLLPLVVAAIDAVPDIYLRTSYTLGVSRWGAVFRVLLPIAAGDIWHGMRLAFGVGWTYLVLAEVVVLAGGLGHVIEIARRRGPRENIYLVIVVITLIAWVADLAWDRLGQWLFPYRGKTV